MTLGIEKLNQRFSVFASLLFQAVTNLGMLAKGTKTARLPSALENQLALPPQNDLPVPQSRCWSIG